MAYSMDELRREQMEWDALQDRIADAQEKEDKRIQSLKEAIETAMDEITADLNFVAGFDYYMDELSFYFDDHEYEKQEAFIKSYLADLEEREQEDWEE